MLRIEIFNSLLKIHKTLEETQIHKYFINNSSERIGPDIIAEDYQKVSLLYNNLQEIDKVILNYFGLKELSSPKIWGRIFASAITTLDNPLSLEFQNISNGLFYFKNYLPMVLYLFRQDSMNEGVIEKALQTKQLQIVDNAIVTLILPEQEYVKSRPERLIDALESITTFYKALARLSNVKENDLEIISMDSGLDKAIDLKGVEKLILSLKAVIAELWDISTFFRDRRMTEGIEWVLRTMKIYQNAVAEEETGRLGAEEAHIMKTGLIEAANKFLATGVITAEIEKSPGYDRVKALSFERKLLVKPSDEIPANEYYQPPAEPAAPMATNARPAETTGDYFSDEQVLFNRFVEMELRKSRFKKKVD